MCSHEMQDLPRCKAIHAPRCRSFQTFLALLLLLGAIHLDFILIPILLCLLPLRWDFLILALLFILTIGPLYEDSNLAQMIAKFICKHAPSYFPITLVMEDMDAFDPKQSYVIVAEPHSVVPIGTIALNGYTGYLPLKKLKGFASNAVFRTPVLRHICSWLGTVPAEMKLLSKYLESGYSCILVPGGIREVLCLERGREAVFLKKRYGFIKAAIHTGSPLVPTYIFGQDRLYQWYKPKGKFYEKLSRSMGFTPLVYWGMFGSPIPNPQPLYVAVGKPIPVEKNVEPSVEQVEELHTKFLSALQKLFEDHKVAGGYADSSLIMY